MASRVSILAAASSPPPPPPSPEPIPFLSSEDQAKLDHEVSGFSKRMQRYWKATGLGRLDGLPSLPGLRGIPPRFAGTGSAVVGAGSAGGQSGHPGPVCRSG